MVPNKDDFFKTPEVGREQAEYSAVKCENHYIDTCGEGQNKRNEKSYTRYVAPN